MDNQAIELALERCEQIAKESQSRRRKRIALFVLSYFVVGVLSAGTWRGAYFIGMDKSANEYVAKINEKINEATHQSVSCIEI